MSKPDKDRVLFCFAEGRDTQWEAFCVDFDLAVQGRSFDEVYRKLDEQIDLYVEGAMALPEADRKRLLNRRAPWRVTIPMTLGMLATAVMRTSRKLRHEYTKPLGPNPLAA